MNATFDGGAVLSSLERVAARNVDPGPAIYSRLFSIHPEMQALFIRDTNGAVRGEMLARVFEMILDYIDRGHYAAHMIRCEVVTHEGYGVPAEVFGLFFGIVRDAVRDLVGSDWTIETERAWAVMLDQMNRLATLPS